MASALQLLECRQNETRELSSKTVLSLLCMLVNCPKCGFSQPKDQYCAQCGIDMILFRPKQDAVFFRYLRHPATSVSLLIFAVCGAFLYVRSAQQNHLQQRVEFLRGGPFALMNADSDVTRSDEEVELGDTTSLASNANSVGGDSSLPSPEDPASTQTLTSLETNELEAIPSGARSNPSGNPNAASREARVYRLELQAHYLEVSLQVAEAWKAEAVSQGQFVDYGSYRAGLLPNAKDKLKNPGSKPLQLVSKEFHSGAMTQQWYVGRRTPQGDLGLTTLVALEVVESQNPSNSDNAQGSALPAAGKSSILLRAEVEMYQSLREDPQGQPVAKPLPLSGFEFPLSTGYFVQLQLPRVAQVPELAGPREFLSLFQSPPWRAKQSEFTLLLQFATPTPSK